MPFHIYQLGGDFEKMIILIWGEHSLTLLLGEDIEPNHLDRNLESGKNLKVIKMGSNYVF